MSNRWPQREVEQLAEMRRRLKPLLDRSPQFPEVIGDRRMLRFLRGQQHDIDKATAKFEVFLKFREERQMNKIRQDIVYGGFDCPAKFPKADIILKYVPQITILSDALDIYGQPVVLEQFDFRPAEVLKFISEEEYHHFLLYSLEYRAIILEQMSEEAERKLMKRYNYKPPLVRQFHGDETDLGYGIIIRCCFIRDLKGIGFDSLGHKGQSIIRPIISTVTANYPEFLGVNYIINVPWIFNVMWHFIKTLLDPPTIAKIRLYGADYLETEMRDTLPMSSLPASVGGQYNDSTSNEVPFKFDTTANTGALWYPGAPEPGTYKSDRKPIEIGSRRVQEPVRQANGHAPKAPPTPATPPSSSTTAARIWLKQQKSVGDDDDNNYEPPHPNQRHLSDAKQPRNASKVADGKDKLHHDSGAPARASTASVNSLFSVESGASSSTATTISDEDQSNAEMDTDNDRNTSGRSSSQESSPLAVCSSYVDELLATTRLKAETAGAPGRLSDKGGDKEVCKGRSNSTAASSDSSDFPKYNTTDGARTRGFSFTEQIDWHHWNEQPLSSKVSILCRRGAYSFVELYIDPIVYYYITYKHAALAFFVVVLGVAWYLRFMISIVTFPCLVYIASTIVL